MIRITVEIPEELESAARNMAMREHRKMEDILQDWLNQYVSEIPVD
jgi:hypothetical protein